MIKTVDEVIYAKNALYYPPKGTRSIGMARANSYLSNFKSYYHSSKNIPLIVIIEHIDAVNNLEELLDTKCIDCIMIGPYDLTGSMGIPGELKNPKYLKVKEKIFKIAKSRNVSIGIHIIEPNIKELKKRVEEKYNFIAYSLDIRIILNSLREASSFVKKIK